MKKIIFMAIMLLVCFGVSANAATNFKIDISAINTEADVSDTVIYTSDFGTSILKDELNASHGFNDFYVVTVVPKASNDNTSAEITSEDVSFDENGATSEDNISIETPSEDASIEINDTSAENNDAPIVSNEPVNSEDGIVSNSSTDVSTRLQNVLEKYRAWRNSTVYEIEKIYSPDYENKNVEIPENGFVIAFPKTTEFSDGGKTLNGSNISVGDEVKLYGIDLEKTTLSNDAYVEIQLSDKGLMEDIPQTGDMSGVVFFCMIGAAAVLVALGAYRRMKKENNLL